MKFNRKSSVMVFGAHPDDVVRGCAGVILRARAAGARVMIVKATDGAALGGPERIPIARRQAAARRREELRALKVLGFPRKNHLLLGFPDAGLEPMRNDYFEKSGLPYLCPWLDADQTFGRDVFRTGASFFGEEFARILRDIVAKARPTHVFTHCSRDRHPDHRALTWFVKGALGAAGLHPAVYEYLTYHTRHQKPAKWPSNPGPRISVKDAAKLRLPGRIVDFALAPGEVRLKNRALDEFIPVVGAAYFKPWRRTNEIFWRTA